MMKRLLFSLPNYIFVYILILGYLLLTPFGFLRNDTSEIGLRSLSPPISLYEKMLSGEGISIELWVTPTNTVQKGPARLFTYSRDPGWRNFTLGQDGRNLVMRLRTTQTDLNGYPEINVGDLFVSGKLQHILVSYDYSTEKVYVDTEKVFETTWLSGRFTNWDKSFSLAIGNELTGNRPWVGDLHLVALYNRALSQKEILKNYKAGRLQGDIIEPNRVTENLVVLYTPAGENLTYTPEQSGAGDTLDLYKVEWLPDNSIKRGKPAKRFLDFKIKDLSVGLHASSQLSDIIANILLFIPMGLLGYSFSKNRYNTHVKSIIAIFLFGTLFSLGVESVQYFIFTRVSSLIDVFSNSLGTMLGIIIEAIRVRFTRKIEIYIT